MNRARYQSLTIKRKLEIIDTVNSLPPGKKKKDIAAECDIPPSTLSTILKNRDSLLAKHALGSNKKKRYREPTRLEVHRCCPVSVVYSCPAPVHPNQRGNTESEG